MRSLLVLLALGLVACAATPTEEPAAAPVAAPDGKGDRLATPIRVRKEGGSAGRIDLFTFGEAGRGERIAHCPEDCFEVTALLPGIDTELEVVATGWPFMRMKGWKNLAPCARTDGGFMSPCRIRYTDIPAEGIVAVFFPRPGFEHLGTEIE